MKTYELKHQLYQQYLKELGEVRGFAFTESEEVQRGWCETYINTEGYKWINIFNHEKEIVGFLILQTKKDPIYDSHWILEAYVLPDYRNQGLMTRHALDYIRRHPGIYSYAYYSANHLAKQFWEHLFSKHCKVRVEEIPVSLFERFAQENDSIREQIEYAQKYGICHCKTFVSGV